MMNRYEELIEQQREEAAELRRLQGEAAMIEKDLPELEAAKDTAVRNNRPEDFRQLAIDIDFRTARLDAIRAKLKAGPKKPSLEDVREAWADVAGDHDKRFSAALDTFSKHAETLLDEYLKLVTMQTETYKKRDALERMNKPEGYSHFLHCLHLTTTPAEIAGAGYPPKAESEYFATLAKTNGRDQDADAIRAALAYVNFHA